MTRTMTLRYGFPEKVMCDGRLEKGEERECCIERITSLSRGLEVVPKMQDRRWVLCWGMRTTIRRRMTYRRMRAWIKWSKRVYNENPECLMSASTCGVLWESRHVIKRDIIKAVEDKMLPLGSEFRIPALKKTSGRMFVAHRMGKTTWMMDSGRSVHPTDKRRWVKTWGSHHDVYVFQGEVVL